MDAIRRRKTNQSMAYLYSPQVGEQADAAAASADAGADASGRTDDDDAAVRLSSPNESRRAFDRLTSGSCASAS